MEIKLAAWQTHLEMGDVHDAILKKLTFSICAQEGHCKTSPGIPRTNLLFNPPKTKDYLYTLDFVQWIDDFIKRASGYY